MAFVTRPVVNVQPIEEKEAATTVHLPAVFSAPIRPDIVHFVHTNMAKNARQPYAVNAKSGTQHSAISWGTGRAVARVPRISGGGTKRSGEGAFANSCRQGRMAHPTKIWRKWHRKINTNQKRYAVVSAIAATGVTGLVMARGHRINEVAEIPLVLSPAVEAIQKTAKAVEALTKIHAIADVDKAKDSHKLRSGAGKMRNRRYLGRRGPLVVFNQDNGIVRAFRNLPGVDLCQVDRLNLLTLAPGGHLGRFVIWTKSAFERLDEIYGTFRAASKKKTDYKLPRTVMTNADLARIINSDEIQVALREKVPQRRTYRHKKNPLKNLGAMIKLNPYAQTVRRQEILKQQRALKRKAERIEAVKAGKKITYTPHEKAEAKRRKLHAPVAKKTFARLVGESAYDASTALKQ